MPQDYIRDFIGEMNNFQSNDTEVGWRLTSIYDAIDNHTEDSRDVFNVVKEYYDRYPNNPCYQFLYNEFITKYFHGVDPNNHQVNHNNIENINNYNHNVNNDNEWENYQFPVDPHFQAIKDLRPDMKENCINYFLGEVNEKSYANLKEAWLYNRSLSIDDVEQVARYALDHVACNENNVFLQRLLNDCVGLRSGNIPY